LDARSGEPIGGPLGHDAVVTAASFSPDGTRIVTASLDHSVRIWDAQSGRPIGQPFHHDDRVMSASFSLGGTRIVTASGNAARIWDVTADLEAPIPEWFPLLLETLGGKQFNEDGSLVDKKQDLFEVRPQLLALKGDDFWSRFGRWFFTQGPERTISPNSGVTVRQWKENQQEAARH
jgi:WD40 repeat protein